MQIDIWGSCVTREIFNVTNDINVASYILQNPIHTIFSKPYLMDDDKKILGTCGFTRRMATLEFKKKAISYFEENFKSEWIVIDACDCRLSYYVARKDNDVRICNNVSTSKTINEYGLMGEFIACPANGIPMVEWEQLVKKFADLIKQKYAEDRIIINEFNFAKYYIQEGSLRKFENNKYISQQGFIDSIEKLLEKNLPNSHILNKIETPVASDCNHLGLAPMHYCKEVYLTKMERIKNIINKSN